MIDLGKGGQRKIEDIPITNEDTNHLFCGSEQDDMTALNIDLLVGRIGRTYFS